MDVEAENQEKNCCHHEGTAADKLKEVNSSTGRTHHDGLYADKTDERQDHFNRLQNPEVGPEVFHVTPHRPPNSARKNGLGGGLVGAAGPGDHGGVGGLAIKAIGLLGGAHCGIERRWTPLAARLVTHGAYIKGGDGELTARRVYAAAQVMWRRAYFASCRHGGGRRGQTTRSASHCFILGYKDALEHDELEKQPAPFPSPD